MAIAVATGSGSQSQTEAEAPLLSDVVPGSVDFKSRPAARSKTGRWKSASFIIGVEVAERVAYFGISSNLISYLTGPLGQSTAAAAANVNTWGGAMWLFPLLGGLVADSILGRYRMIITASLFYILGLGFLSLSAILHSDSYDDCTNTGKNKPSCSPPQLEIVFFFLSLYLTALAQGGNKPCVLAFAADQFDDNDQTESKLKSSLFNWWNCILCMVVVLAGVVLNYVQDNLSWGLSFGILCIITCLALLLFLLGTMTYRFHIDGDGISPLESVYHIIRNASKKWKAKSKDASVPEPIQPHEDAGGSRFFDKAYICEDVDPTKAALGLISIWSTCLGFSVIHSQISTLFVKQAATLDRNITPGFQIPVASIQVLMEVGFIVFIPIYDCILVPLARSITKKPAGISMLQRIGTGLFLSLVGMIIAAVVEIRRLAVADEYGMVNAATLPMSVWWLAPQYLVFGVGDVFTLVGLQEFFYDQVPRELRSIGIALYLSVVGVGHLLSSFLIHMVAEFTDWISDNLNRSHLDYLYWLLFGIGAFAFAAYLYSANSYVYRTRVGI